MSSRRRLAGLGALGATAALLLAGCSSPEPRGPVSPAPSGATSASSAAPVPTDEPTTTNTLPPPPEPSGPAPSTAGPLSAGSLPVPDGWRTVEPPGNDEIGQPGNGTWVQALDPRYAAQGAVAVGCADVTRDDYPDPVVALEGGYESSTGDPGVGLALEFGDEAQAQRFWRTYVVGVRACDGATDGISTSRVREPATAGGQGLVDRRTDETQEPSDWTEAGALRGRRVVLLNLADPGHAIGDGSLEALLARIPA